MVLESHCNGKVDIQDICIKFFCNDNNNLYVYNFFRMTAVIYMTTGNAPKHRQDSSCLMRKEKQCHDCYFSVCFIG